MTTKNVARLLGSATVAMMLLSSGVAFAQTYDCGTQVSHAGMTCSLVPGGTLAQADTGYGATGSSSTGLTGSAGVSTPGIPNTGTGTTGSAGMTTSSGSSTPGIPNTGAGGGSAVNLVLLALSAALVAGGIAVIARQQRAA